eukprot:m51a1_g13259 putative protein os-9 isoform x1 (263) ;mRNA; f:160-1337
MATNGWWSYQFCYGRSVDEKGNVGAQYTLGADVESREQAKGRYTEVYGGGTPCEVDRSLVRTTRVDFLCDPVSPGAIRDITETSTCAYHLVFVTSLVCAHPLMRPEPVARQPAPSDVVCVTERPEGLADDQCTVAPGESLAHGGDDAGLYDEGDDEEQQQPGAQATLLHTAAAGREVQATVTGAAAADLRDLIAQMLAELAARQEAAKAAEQQQQQQQGGSAHSGQGQTGEEEQQQEQEGGHGSKGRKGRKASKAQADEDEQ